MQQLPKKITPCPIKQTIFEMRFNSELPDDAIFGILYNEFRDTYKKVEQLPILQLPPVVRSQDPNLIWAPHYKLSNEKSTIQIGPKVFSLVYSDDYDGWDNFSKEILDNYEKANNSNVIKEVNRIALRYINVFEEINILDNADFTARLGSESLNHQKINFSVEIPSEKGVSQLKIINNAEVMMNNTKSKGSLIDIDSAVDFKDFDSFSDAIEYSHKKEKELFFRVLGEEYIGTLKTEFDKE